MPRPGFVLEVDRSTPPTLFWHGEGFRLERLPTGSRVIYAPEPLEPLADPDCAIRHALLNPTGDTHNYFEFEINALNTGWDLFLPKPYREGGKADNSWDIPGLRTAVSVNGTLNNPRDTDRGWMVEIAFPWTAFASRASVSRSAAGDEWRVNFSRVEWRTGVVDGKYVKPPGQKEDNWVWSPQGLINMHVPDRWGYVRFTR